MTENHLPTPFNIEQVAPIFFLVLVDVLGLTVILPLLHLYAAQFNATPFQIGLVVAVFPLAQLIGVPVMGALSDRFGRKPLLLISQISTCVGFVILALANSLWLIVLSRLIDGIFGANLATAQAALSDMTDDAHRTQALGLTGAAFGVGFILGPLIAALSLTFSDNLALPAWIAAGYSLFSIFLTAGMFRETLPAPKRRVESIPRKTVFAAFSMLTDPRINGFLALMFAQQVVFFGFESFLGLFTLSRLGLLGGGNAYIFLAVGIVLVAVQGRFIGRWSRRYGERRLVGIALALLGIGLVLVAFTPRQPPLSYIRARAERELNQRQAT
ncbi:MAG: MFS transporter, partial [Phototrophicaceae bacterium]